MQSLLTNSGWDGRVCRSHCGTQAGGLPTPLHCGWPRQLWTGGCVPTTALPSLCCPSPARWQQFGAICCREGERGWGLQVGLGAVEQSGSGERGSGASRSTGSFLALMAAGHLQMCVWRRETRRFSKCSASLVFFVPEHTSWVPVID